MPFHQLGCPHRDALAYRWRIYRGGVQEIRFTASEWKILVFLVSNAGRLVSRLQLLQSCFPESLESYDRIIDTHIKNIRSKFGPGGSEWIETVRGYGYRFRGSLSPM